MLCTKGLISCSKDAANLSIYAPGCKTAVSAVSAGCLMAKAKMHSPAGKVKKVVKRACHTAQPVPMCSGAMKSSLGYAGHSGLVAMSPWTHHEVVRRVNQSQCPRYSVEDKENSVMSEAPSSFYLSRAESVTSLTSNVSRIGKLGIRGRLNQ